MRKANKTEKPSIDGTPAAKLCTTISCIMIAIVILLYVFGGDKMDEGRLGASIVMVPGSIFLFLMGRCVIILDENGCYQKTLLREKRYAWSDVVSVGIETIEESELTTYAYVRIKLRDGQSITVAYNRAVDRCIRYYYGRYDYDHYDGFPD